MSETMYLKDFHTEDFIPVEVVSLEEFDANALVSGSEVNVIVGDCDWALATNLFYPVSSKDLFLKVPREINWAQLLFALKVYPSKSQALKNWKALGRELEIRVGFETFHLGKARKIEVHIWKPVSPPVAITP